MNKEIKPIIAISQQIGDEPDTLLLYNNYIRFVESQGALAFVLPNYLNIEDMEVMLNICDGIILPGGDDGHFDREKAESKIIEIAIKKDIPLLGICMGLQVSNVVLGGTTKKDIPNHWQIFPYNVVSHSVDVIPSTPLFEMLGESKIQVNSMHNNCIDVLANSLVIMAMDDKVIEAAYRPENSFFMLFQWHPEFIIESNSSKAIAESFVRACKRYHNKKI